MKRLTSLFLSLMLLFALCACGTAPGTTYEHHAAPTEVVEETEPVYVDYSELFAEDISWSGEKTFVDENAYETVILNVSYRCPQLDTSKGDFEYVNSLIYNEYRACFESTEYDSFYCDGQTLFNYETGGRDDVVSILLKIAGEYDHTKFIAYNVRISTGELLSDEEFLREIRCKDYDSRLEAAAGQKVLDLYDSMGLSRDQATDDYNTTISEDNLSLAQPLFIGDRFSAVCPIYSAAGKGSYTFMLDLE